jgi:hypothetical protein
MNGLETMFGRVHTQSIVDLNAAAAIVAGTAFLRQQNGRVNAP